SRIATSCSSRAATTTGSARRAGSIRSAPRRSPPRSRLRASASPPLRDLRCGKPSRRAYLPGMAITVREHMSVSPYTIGKDQTLAAASRLMRKHDIRHLPVLEGGALLGILSVRDVYLVQTL